MPIDTWSSWLSEVGIVSTLTGCASARSSATRAAAVYWATMYPLDVPASAVRNAGRRPFSVGDSSRKVRRSEIEPRSASVSRRVSKASARLWPWKLPADHLQRILEHQWVVGHGVEVGVHQLGEEAVALAGGAVDLGRATQRVGVLEAADPGPAVRADPDSAAAMLAALVCWPRRSRRRCTRGSNAGSAPRSASTVVAATMSTASSSAATRTLSRAPMALMKCVPLISASPSLLSSSRGSTPEPAQDLGARDHAALRIECLALADQRQKGVSGRRQVAAGARAIRCAERAGYSPR